MVADAVKYKRLMLKLSGEALMGNDDYGINMETAAGFARDIKQVVDEGVQLAIVVGGGNIFRGMQGAAKGMERADADYMGMLATVMNGLALSGVLRQNAIPAVVMSAIPMPTICESYCRNRALSHLENGKVVIFAGGTGNPFFTTDTAATLRAVEMNCECLAKATQVDGVYSADPKTNPDATRFETLHYDKILSDNLKIMDGAAIALARDNKLPLVVFSIHEPGNLLSMVKGTAKATTVLSRD
ncbi:MAG: uridylate kinase [Rhodomicrobium sp.]|nr:MAG: uridylate kinase [Rhodomicrobium sp.]